MPNPTMSLNSPDSRARRHRLPTDRSACLRISVRRTCPGAMCSFFRILGRALPLHGQKQGVLSGSMAYRVAKGFAVGPSLTHVNLGDQRVAEPHLDISAMKFWPGLRSGPSRELASRISTALENVNAARVDRTFSLGRGFVFTERYALPVISAHSASLGVRP